MICIEVPRRLGQSLVVCDVEDEDKWAGLCGCPTVCRFIGALRSRQTKHKKTQGLDMQVLANCLSWEEVYGLWTNYRWAHLQPAGTQSPEVTIESRRDLTLRCLRMWRFVDMWSPCPAKVVLLCQHYHLLKIMMFCLLNIRKCCKRPPQSVTSPAPTDST